MKINNKTKVLLTGAGGMLGDAFYNLYFDKVKIFATDIDLNEKWITYLDFRDKETYKKDDEIAK